MNVFSLKKIKIYYKLIFPLIILLCSYSPCPHPPKIAKSHSVAWMVLELILGIPYSCWCPTMLEGPLECLQAPGSTTGMTL